MSVTVLQRWTVKDIVSATRRAKMVKSFWLKYGATDFRLDQVFTGPHTGHVILSVVLPDMATFSKAQAAVATNTAKLKAAASKDGDSLVEREIWRSIDL